MSLLVQYLLVYSTFILLEWINSKQFAHKTIKHYTLYQRVVYCTSAQFAFSIEVTQAYWLEGKEQLDCCLHIGV